MSRIPARSRAAAAAAMTALLLLTGCASSDAPADEDAPVTSSAFPRTIEVPGARGSASTELTIDAEPQAIAALDYESAEVLAELGLADRVVLIPEAVLNPAIGGHIDELSAVETTFPVSADLDAETVISVSPDLVVMSPRHGAEDTIGQVLVDAGLTTLQLPASWTNPETLATNIDLIGQATGTDTEADELAQEIEDGLAAHSAGSAAADDADKPRILVLTNQAGRAFVTAGEAFPLRLLELAGGTNAGDALGFDRTGAITAEQVVEANPDGILLIDMNGSGTRLFSELLSNPAVAALPAAAEDQLLLLTGREVQALGLTETANGLETLGAWVAGR